MKSKALLILFFAISINVFSQKKDAFPVIDTLSSKSMYGRGYVNNGHKIAANFISENFNNMGLTPLIENNFFQSFSIDVNTFPNSLKIVLGDNLLEQGEDFIVESYSGSALGTFDLLKVDKSNFYSFIKKDLRLKKATAVVLDVSNIEGFDTLIIFNELKMEISQTNPVIWLTGNKLTWSVSDFQKPFPVIQTFPDVLSNHQSISLSIKNSFIPALITQNVCGIIKGKKKKYIVLSAHYDHLGMMGDAIFPGANDNASGTALLLSLAKQFSKTKPKYNMLFLSFGAEEVGLKGSKYFTDNPLVDLDKIKFMINLDIVGTGEDGIAIVNGKSHRKEVKMLSKINNKDQKFNKIKIRGQAPNSDHYWFSSKGVPAIFIYTLGGVKAYHDIHDIRSTLPLSRFNQLHDLIIAFINRV